MATSHNAADVRFPDRPAGVTRRPDRRVAALGKGAPLPADRALRSGRRVALKRCEFTRQDTSFDVENYYEYVTMQSESAVRQVVSERWYDGDDDGNNSLRSDLEAVARLLIESIQSHCALAGLEILEARISHLAYAPEIAGAMLRRQQAVAVVAARTQIVEGAVSMVRLGIDKLEADKVVSLGDADRVRLVTNLMTVLVGDSETQPVLSVDHGGEG